MYETIPNLFERLDLRKLYPGYSGTVAYTRCPAHNDDGRPNLAVYPRNTFCFVCKFRESALEHVMRVYELQTVSEAFAVFHKILHDSPTGALSPAGQRPEPKPLREDIIDYYRKELLNRPDKQSWLRNKYGLSNQGLLDSRVGYTGRSYALPVFDLANELVQVRFRRDDAVSLEPPKYWNLAGHSCDVWFLPPNMRGPEPWPVSTIRQAAERVLNPVWEEEAPYVVLTEGEYDALAAYEQGYPALSALNGAQALSSAASHLLRTLRDLRVYIAYDQDEAGQAGALHIMERLNDLNIECANLVWPRRLYGKDVSEKWVAGHDLFAGVNFGINVPKPLTTAPRSHIIL